MYIAAHRSFNVSLETTGENSSWIAIPVEFEVANLPQAVAFTAYATVGELVAATGVTVDFQVGANDQLIVESVVGNIAGSAGFVVEMLTGEIDNILNPTTNRYEIDLSGYTSLVGNFEIGTSRSSVTTTIVPVLDTPYGEVIKVNLVKPDNEPAEFEAVAYYAGTTTLADNKDIEDNYAELHLAKGTYDIVVQPKVAYAATWRAQAYLNFPVSRGLHAYSVGTAIIEEHVVRGYNETPLQDVLVRAYDTSTNQLVGVAFSSCDGIWKIDMPQVVEAEFVFTKPGIHAKNVTVEY